MSQTKKTTSTRRDPLGDGMTALCGGALALNLLLVVALLIVLLVNGMGYFWQRPLVRVEMTDGRVLMGEIHDREEIPAQVGDGQGGMRMRLKQANRDLTGADFVWLDESDVLAFGYPEDALLLERVEWGNFYGRAVELRRGDQRLVSGSTPVWEALGPLLDRKHRELAAIHRLERGDIGDVNRDLEALRLERRKLERKGVTAPDPRLARLEENVERAQTQFEALSRRLFDMREELLAEKLVMEAAEGRQREVAVGDIVRAVEPNRLGLGGKLGLYASRLWEFVADDPRESNTEGGIFPAIFGTVMMVFLMSFAVTPLGILAALYLREYARQGPFVRLVRIAVNNLAGVPSIVFGVFGLGFFVYLIGGTIDRMFYPEALPAPTYGTGGILWASLTLALLTVPVVIVATEEGLAAVPRVVREGSLALGATKFETTWRVVVPAAAPGILTGVILAMARAAGEVAPLMIVGMVKLAPALPIDGNFPFVHFERKFMHLGFHIYDVGFQSPNVEAVKPLVFATALLLIAVVTAMNLVAITVRNHLRKKYATSAV